MKTTIVPIPSHEPIQFQFNPASPVQMEMAQALASAAGYEPATWDAFREFIRPGDTVVDVGAHVGVLTCLAGRLVGPTGHVIAFEPHLGNRAQLLKHIRLNGMDWIEADKRAVSDEPGTVPFYACADNDGGHALWDPALSKANVLTKARPSVRPVQTVRLDDAIPKARRPVRFLKIDTEGAEVHVLRGAERILREDRPIIVGEVNWCGLQYMGEQESTLRAFLRDRDYTEYGLQNTKPYRILLRPDKTFQEGVMQNGQPVLYVFNQLWLPNL